MGRQPDSFYDERLLATNKSQLKGNENSMPTSAQIKKIHALKAALGIEDPDYRSMLAGFRKEDGTAAQSSRDLSTDQASGLIERLDKVADSVIRLGEIDIASPAQRRKIMIMWAQVSHAKDNAGRRNTLRAFLKNKFQVSNLDRITINTAPKVIKTLRMMQENEEKKFRHDSEDPDQTSLNL